MRALGESSGDAMNERTTAVEAENARLREVVSECVEAVRLTREYVMPTVLLPAKPGWCWYDTTEHARAVLDGEEKL